ncbi:hypothetical protein CEUSTIGMA_g7678.t1 [Chlamydomonas eustigma]|uniref:Peptidase M3A/M3B catalytic domain-containing protein n=1 Tax=Chlamydomonas eustigma TaxID=1157962 RepID=A0A250XBU6_9CHLO|nr:hypothetical protein CEUSTIGMA_g7678.t1 [Chlamydomonas eustigma]|eukprot:GAX80240.1 hypothetical protein CEUSTIGMA_g7678.t1 [Chlamydomonas eustigma]
MKASTNPILSDWENLEPFGLPPFAKISADHFRPAFDVALASNLEEIKGIAECSDPPSFSNTAQALDRSGELCTRVGNLFSNLCSSHTSPELQAVELEMAPILAAHSNKIYTYPGLFPRLEAVYNSRAHSDLNPEQVRLVERLHLDFVRAGAKFDAAAQCRYSEIMEKLAELETVFTQNVLADEAAYTIVLKAEELAGCPSDLVAAARQAAVERNQGTEDYVITLSRSLVEPFLTFADRRDLRERAWRAWTKRGELDPSRDNRAIAKKILLLRAEQARMHGFNTFAAYQTDDTMARSPGRVMELLENVWGRAKDAAERERQAMEEFLASLPLTTGEGKVAAEKVDIQPWDWRYYAEKVRQAKYDFDEAALKPYLSLEAVTKAVFDVAGKLFGLKFVKRGDVTAYHPDVVVYEVRESSSGLNTNGAHANGSAHANGQPSEISRGSDRLVAIFLHDNFSRPNKRSGAWMSELRSALPCEGIVPIILNNNNFARGTGPTLLSFDDAKTLFHEFGHGCHGMLSNSKYNRLAGTNVLRDFVELPSQLMEHWLDQPEVMKKHARHFETGEVIPDALLSKLKAARSFNQGFGTIEYTASALVDQALHQLPADKVEALDINKFEEQELSRLGMPQGIVMRHRPAHFQHLFSSSSYAAAYYVYLWAEVLDADGFEAFLEAGSCFDPATAARAKEFIYSSGNSLEPGAAFKAFRGQDPIIEPMLKKKGMFRQAETATVS